MARLRRCAESLTAEERETLAQAAATLPEDWTVDVLRWGDVGLTVLVPDSGLARLQLEVRVRAPTAIQIKAVGQPRPVDAAAEFIKEVGLRSSTETPGNERQPSAGPGGRPLPGRRGVARTTE